jgi:hypothetical protein
MSTSLSQFAAQVALLAKQGDCQVLCPSLQIRFEDFETLFAGVEVTHSATPTGDHYSARLPGGTEVHCFRSAAPVLAPRKVTL